MQELIVYSLSLGFVFFCSEYAVGYGVLKLFGVQRSLELGRQVEFRIRVFEIIVSSYIAVGGLVLATVHYLSDMDFLYGYNSAMKTHAYIMLAYFIYHLITTRDIGRKMPKIMPVHHVLMILFCYSTLINDSLYFYLMIAAVPSASAVLRNWTWFTKRKEINYETLSCDCQDCLYCLFQVVPVMIVLGHLAAGNFLLIPSELYPTTVTIGLVAAYIAVSMVKDKVLRLVQQMLFRKYQNMNDKDEPYKQQVKLVLDENKNKKYKVVAYDLFMFIQLVAFYALCWSLGIVCLVLNKITGRNIFLDGFIGAFSKIANMGKAP